MTANESWFVMCERAAENGARMHVAAGDGHCGCSDCQSACERNMRMRSTSTRRRWLWRPRR